jgi:glycosyltransferase involved in cell wall biosynthesis
VPNGAYVLTVGQLRLARNHDLLLEPIERAMADGYFEKWILVGDGPDAAPLVRQCEAALGDRFTHVSHATPNRVAALLQGATCFASVPTRDIWGFAVQEAIMSGVPVVIAPSVGCGADLVYPGSGGYITSTGPAATASFTQDVYEGLVKAASADTQARSAAAAIELRKQWTPRLAARNFIAQLRSRVKVRT